MGIVYLCEHEKTRRKVAVKFLHPRYTNDPRANRKFEEEARIVARLKHKNIVTVYDLKKHEGHYYLVMEYLKGPTLSSTLRHSRLSFREVFSIVRQVLEALDHAHGQGIVHHDVKLSNIILQDNGIPVLGDFGLSSIQSRYHHPLHRHKLFGTPHYIAPEKITGTRSPEREHQADLFSAGVLFYRLLTHRFPFEGDERKTLFDNICSVEPLPPVEIDPDIPLPVNAIVMKLLEKDPRRRYGSAREALADLENYRMNRTVSAMGDTLSYRMLMHAWRSRAKILLIVFLSLLLCVMGFFIHRQFTRRKTEWSRDRNLGPRFDTFEIEKNWKAFDPRRLEPLPSSRVTGAFDLDKGTLVCTPEKSFLLQYARNGALGDFRFALRVVSSSPGRDRGSFGIFYGALSAKDEKPSGLFFALEDGGISVRYPRFFSPKLAERKIRGPVGEATLELEKHFPDLVFKVNGKKRFRADLFFFPLNPAFTRLGFFSSGSARIVSGPSLFLRETPLSASPLYLPLRLLSRGETKSAGGELQRLTAVEQPALKAEAAYYLGMTLFASGEMKKGLGILGAHLDRIADPRHAARVRLLLNEKKYTEGTIGFDRVLPPELDREESERELLLLYRKRFLENAGKIPLERKERMLRDLLTLKTLPHAHFFPLALDIARARLDRDAEGALSFVRENDAVFRTKIDEYRASLIGLLFDIAEELRRDSKFEKAAAVYRTILERADKNDSDSRFAAWYALSDSYRALGKLERAKACLEKAVTQR
jgi:tetratricopeptide (TPR) repeat protein